MATIANNIIEKGPDASNYAMIHYGGENQNQYANNSLTVTGNLMLNDAVTKAYVYGGAINNPAAVTGINDQLALTLGKTGAVITPVVTGNQSYGLATGQLAVWMDDPSFHKAATSFHDENANSSLSIEPALSTANPLTNAPVIALPTGPQTLNLTISNETVTGNGSLFTVTDSAGGNIINGGKGGLTVTESGQYAKINTLAGATDLITETGRSTINSAGNDVINGNGNYSTINVSGTATINTHFYDTINVSGSATLNGASVVNIASGGNATVNLTATSDALYGTLAAGASITVNDKAAGTSAVATISGTAGFTVNASGGTYGGITVTAKSAGLVNAVFTSGNNSITTDGGQVSIQSGSGNTKFHFDATLTETDVITGFKPGHDSLILHADPAHPVTASSLIAGETAASGGGIVLHLSASHSITLVGLAASQLHASDLNFV